MTVARDLLEALQQRGWTLGIAESLTGGALSSEVVSVPGASASLLGGVVAYATPVKHTLLGVDATLLAEHGPVHPLVAEQMAAGIRTAVAVEERPADVGISTTGIAGPDSPDGQAVGTVYVGIVTPSLRRSVAFRFDGDRAEVRAQSVQAALRAALESITE